MPDNDALLKLLSRPGFHSGPELGASLGISRVAVNKRIESLIAQGLPVQAVHGKGYRLDGDVALLDAQVIKAGLTPSVDSSVADIHVLTEINSTSDWLGQKEVKLNQATVCLAESQQQGRGRRGNEWISDPYKNIMLSLSWGFESWPHQLSGLSLAASLLLAEAMREEYDIDVKIKWPNDLLVNGDKLAGLLIDVKGEVGSQCQLVMGIGVNVDQSVHASAEYRWCDLRSLGCMASRNNIVALILNQWVPLLSQFPETGFAPFVERWNALSSYSGERIVAKTRQGQIEGMMQGVDSSGSLILHADDGQSVSIADSMTSIRLL